MTTLHDFRGVTGRPLDTFFRLSQFYGHGPWLVCEVALIFYVFQITLQELEVTYGLAQMYPLSLSSTPLESKLAHLSWIHLGYQETFSIPKLYKSKDHKVHKLHGLFQPSKHRNN